MVALVVVVPETLVVLAVAVATLEEAPMAAGLLILIMAVGAAPTTVAPTSF